LFKYPNIGMKIIGNVKNKIMSIIKSFINLILPPRCPITGDIVDEVGMISAEAWSSLHFIAEPNCISCGVPFDIDQLEVDNQDSYMTCATCLANPPEYDVARSAIIYSDQSKDLILAFKHGDQTHLTVTFTPWLNQIVQNNQWQTVDYIIPVPLHWTRLFKRRYNQASLLANALSSVTNIPSLNMILKRIKKTETQGHLSFKDRHENVKNAFVIDEKHQSLLTGKTVILIDDVFTTGATIEECTKILRKAGVQKICVITVARALRQGVSV
jgi:ComF family protein